jgi:hypothetical protein
VADIISLVNTDSKGASTSALAGLEWIRTLRDRQLKYIPNQSHRTPKKNHDYETLVPRVYRKDHPHKNRDEIKEYYYKGNFMDI